MVLSCSKLGDELGEPICRFSTLGLARLVSSSLKGDFISYSEDRIGLVVCVGVLSPIYLLGLVAHNDRVRVSLG